MIVLILILLTLWLIVCALCAAVGYFIGQGKRKRVKPPEPTEKQIREAKRAEEELSNMLNYNGDEQTDIDV